MISKPGQIVVGVDLSDSSETGKVRPLALANFAQALQAWLNSPVHLIFVKENDEEDDKASLDNIAYLERLQKLAQNRHWTFSLKSGNPVSELLSLDTGSAHSAELYVVGMREVGIIKRLYLGSVTGELAKKSEKPLAILSSLGVSRWEIRPEFSTDRRLLVATDLSDHSNAVEEYGLSLAKRGRASVTLLHNTWRTYKSMEDAAIQAGAVPLIFEETIQTIEKQAREALSKKRQMFEEQGVECDLILDTEPDSFSESVVALQDSGYSMLVMGSRTRNRLVTAVWGSTLRDVLAMSYLPIVAVKC